MTTPSKQKALLLEEKFGSFNLINEFPVPKPGKNEVLVKVYSTALNPVDWKIQKGYFIEKFPSVVGSDLAGEVVQLGEDSGDFKIGDRVFFQGILGRNEYCGFLQYALADTLTLGKIPDNVSYEEASTLPVTLTTAYIGLYNSNPYGMAFEAPILDNARGKYHGVPIVVLGGASSVGQSVIQLAKLSGFSPIITTASLKHTSFLQSLGATHVVDRNVSLTKAFIRETITPTPVAAVYDAISLPETQKQAIEVVASDGQITVVLPATDEVAAKAKLEGKRINWVVAFKVSPQHVELLRAFWPKAEDLLRSGDIKPNPVEVLPRGLNGIVDGLKRLEEDKVSGLKLVARPQETL